MPLLPKQALAIALLALALALPASAERPVDPAEPLPEEAGETLSDDSTHLEALAFPGARSLDAVRLHFQSRFVPDADLGPGHASLYRPDLRGRLTIPVSDRAVLRLSTRAGMGRYEFRGPDPYFHDSLDLYQTRLAVQGAYRLNDERFRLWREGERWSLLASLHGGSQFESGAFEDGLSGGGALVLGFELPGTLRVAAGVSVSSSPQGGGVSVSPTGFLRWNMTEAVTLRNRGLGVQLEYRWNPRLELFLSGFRSTSRYALDRASGLDDVGRTTSGLNDLLLRDRMFLTGAGFEWKISKVLRINTEAGVVAWRRLRVESDDLGTLVSRRGGPSVYLEMRLEIRP